MSEKKYFIRSKLWIENAEGKVAFGAGRLKVLDAIDRLGSMNSAAKELKMSYRAVWCRIRESEERIGRDLVIREGKGSKLTPFARNLMKQFEKLESKICIESDKMFDSLLSDSLD